MRTSQAKQQLLLREARLALDLARNIEVYTAIKPIVTAVNGVLDGSAIVSHYRNNTWGITWYGLNGQEQFLAFKADALKLPPDVFIAKHIQSQWRQTS